MSSATRVGAALLSCLLIVLPVVACAPPTTPRQSVLSSTPSEGASAEHGGAPGRAAPPIYFVENRGQVDGSVAYTARAGALTAFFTPGGVTYTLAGRHVDAESAPWPEQPMLRRDGHLMSHTDDEVWALKVDYLGADPTSLPVGEQRTDAVFSSFPGPGVTWKAGLSSYAEVDYPHLWSGIDLVYGQHDRHLKSSFVVQPGADPGQIRFSYRGATSARLTEGGDLEIVTPLGAFEEARPVAFQEREGQRLPVGVSYLADLNAPSETLAVGFSVDTYDPTLPLVIDPDVTYSTYLGGEGEDAAQAIAADANGNTYVAGQTHSTTFPKTPGAAGVAPEGAFVTKLNPQGTAIIYSAVLGGSRSGAYGIAVDSAGNAYVAGSTDSDFPTTPGAVQPISVAGGGQLDAFVTKIDPTGTSLAYSTFLGGGAQDQAFGIAVDSSGAAYVAGLTGSGFIAIGADTTPFPTTPGAFQPALDPGGYALSPAWDAFVTKLNPQGSALVYSTYLGGNGEDYALGIGVSSAGEAVVTGLTMSPTFPTVAAFDNTCGLDGQCGINGAVFSDAFVTKLNAQGTALVYSTFLGGSDTDQGNAVAVDAAGNAYVTGRAGNSASHFPTTSGAFQEQALGPNIERAFVARFTSSGVRTYTTYLTSTAPENSPRQLIGDEIANGIAIDTAGDVYVTGWYTGNSWPTTPDAFQLHNAGNETDEAPTYDAFVTELNPQGSGLVYSTYLGGTREDKGLAIATDSAGGIYVTGTTTSRAIADAPRSTNFPLRNPVQPAIGSVNAPDGFVTKFGGIGAPLPPAVCSPRPRIVVSVVRNGAGGLNVTLSAGQPAGAGNDRLTELRFSPARNGLIDLAPQGSRPGLSGSTGNTTVTLSEQPASISFTVRRAPGTPAGAGVTVPLTVVDRCGSWSTFVGGGPSAF